MDRSLTILYILCPYQVNADVTLDIHDVKIFLDATAQLTENGLAQGDLKVKNFYVSDLIWVNSVLGKA